MPFGLEFLEEFIQTEIRLKQQSQSPLNESDARDKLMLLESEIEKIKRQLRSFMFQASSENQMENSIQLFQANLVTIADAVMKCRESMADDWDSYERILCVSIYAHIDDLLKYTEKYFSKYFNQDEFVPVAYVWMARNEVSDRLSEIEPLVKKTDIDEGLLKIALYPIRDFINQRDKSFTYRRIIYIRQLTTDLKDKLSKDNCSTETIFDQLCYLNYNNFHFLAYISEKISIEVKDQPTLSGQIETLSFWVKRFNQRQTKPDFALKRDRPSIQEQINTWLQEEIYFIEKKKQLTLLFPATGQVSKPEAFKIVTNLSVPQLGFVIKILKETGVIKNPNQTDVIRFFAQNFSTEKNKNISPESLRIKYYTAETSAIRSVQDVLNKLMQHIKENN